MIISLIWAMDENGLIGVDNSLPWKLPADMQWFRKNTLGKPIVMGRKTFESFGGRPLPQRTNIVITRDQTYQADDAVIVHSIEAAIQAAGDAEELMVIGGSSFYEQMLPQADRLYVTRVHGEFKGDAWFPNVDWSLWQEVGKTDSDIDEKNGYACSFIEYQRQ
ncbi:MAG TPA: type 3 dihydrofolate reductase [Ectothiorhodospiraceae bacterium]|nr:type 3 dihydrofolate reductase [Ectothiorhodospiraceae bacterium]